LLVELADRFGIPQALETVRVFSAWERIVGDQVASRCEPVMIREGVLKVRASSAAWASELRYLSGEIARRVNQELGREMVTEVVISVVDPLASRGTKAVGPGGGSRRVRRSKTELSENTKSGRLAAKTRKKRP
jgi:predicted nucleic acid-binding Zn ribbon protein